MSNREKLNAVLKGAGFAGLEDPRSLLDQIAVNIEDHNDFRRLLWETEPAERTNAYCALATRLRFTPKPLEDYLTESRTWASERYSHSPAARLAEVAVDAIERADCEGTLTVVCAYCTKEARFAGVTQVDATQKARRGGWVYDPANDKEICPKCAKARGVVN